MVMMARNGILGFMDLLARMDNLGFNQRLARTANVGFRALLARIIDLGFKTSMARTITLGFSALLARSFSVGFIECLARIPFLGFIAWLARTGALGFKEAVAITVQSLYPTKWWLSSSLKFIKLDFRAVGQLSILVCFMAFSTARMTRTGAAIAMVIKICILCSPFPPSKKPINHPNVGDRPRIRCL